MSILLQLRTWLAKETSPLAADAILALTFSAVITQMLRYLFS